MCKIILKYAWGYAGVWLKEDSEGRGRREGDFRDPGVLKVSGMDVKSLGIDIYNCQN